MNSAGAGSGSAALCVPGEATGRGLAVSLRRTRHPCVATPPPNPDPFRSSSQRPLPTPTHFAHRRNAHSDPDPDPFSLIAATPTPTLTPLPAPTRPFPPFPSRSLSFIHNVLGAEAAGAARNAKAVRAQQIVESEGQREQARVLDLHIQRQLVLRKLLKLGLVGRKPAHVKASRESDHDVCVHGWALLGGMRRPGSA